MFWLAYLFTVIVGGTFAVILRVLRKVLRSWGVGSELAIKTRPYRIAEH
jgi:hypothetical protein